MRIGSLMCLKGHGSDYRGVTYRCNCEKSDKLYIISSSYKNYNYNSTSKMILDFEFYRNEM